jgi:hypothetical protein
LPIDSQWLARFVLECAQEGTSQQHQSAACKKEPLVVVG